jgi:hypothetical protein
LERHESGPREKEPGRGPDFFLIGASGKYKAEFQAGGLANVSATLNSLTNLKLIEMSDSFAYFQATTPINGNQITFEMDFDYENGGWKISSF